MSKKLPNKLHQILVARGWVAADLAQATGYSLQYIYHLSAGVNRRKGRAAVEAVLGTEIWPRQNQSESKGGDHGPRNTHARNSTSATAMQAATKSMAQICDEIPAPATPVRVGCTPVAEPKQ